MSPWPRDLLQRLCTLPWVHPDQGSLVLDVERRPRAGQGALLPLSGTSNRTPARTPARTPTPASAARQRKLHVGHFAFMRSVVQGLDPRDSWERYLRVEGEVTDERAVRATIAWIRDEFAAAAKREDRFGTARLVRIDATRIADPSLELPSLEAFAEARGLEYERQADQIAVYEAEYGRATQRLRRRARLIARQLEALRWLEDRVAQSPKAGDSVAAWLNPTLASHLEAADIFTLAQLVERINGVGRRWHAVGCLRCVGRASPSFQADARLATKSAMAGVSVTTSALTPWAAMSLSVCCASRISCNSRTGLRLMN